MSEHSVMKSDILTQARNRCTVTFSVVQNTLYSFNKSWISEQSPRFLYACSEFWPPTPGVHDDDEDDHVIDGRRPSWLGQRAMPLGLAPPHSRQATSRQATSRQSVDWIFISTLNKLFTPHLNSLAAQIALARRCSFLTPRFRCLRTNALSS